MDEVSIAEATSRTIDPETGEIVESARNGSELLSQIRLARLQWKSRYGKDPQRVMMTKAAYCLLPIEQKADRNIQGMKIQEVETVPATGVIGSGDFVLMEFEK